MEAINMSWWARHIFNSIEDMMNAYYTSRGGYYVQKADAPVISTTTGVYNAIYGAKVTVQLNTEANAWAILPKVPYGKSGWRVETARPSGPPDGQGETATIPETSKPTWLEVSAKPKIIAHTFNNSIIQETLVKGDDAIGDMAMMRARYAIHHAERINVNLLQDFDTLAGNNIESLDRVCSSNAEQSGVGATAGDEDIYGIDRSANAWADAYVDENDDSDRELTDSLMRGAIIDNIPERGGTPDVVLTGLDTKSAIVGEYSPAVRYGGDLGEGEFSIGFNGVQTDKGKGFGVRVTTLYGTPIIVSKDVKKDTLSRIYVLDTSDDEGFGTPRLGIELAVPTSYYEAGISTGNPFAINAFGDKGMYVTVAELKSRFLAVQGKIRDLK